MCQAGSCNLKGYSKCLRCILRVHCPKRECFPFHNCMLKCDLLYCTAASHFVFWLKAEEVRSSRRLFQRFEIQVVADQAAAAESSLVSEREVRYTYPICAITRKLYTNVSSHTAEYAGSQPKSNFFFHWSYCHMTITNFELLRLISWKRQHMRNK